jgi:hypothetical protein
MNPNPEDAIDVPTVIAIAALAYTTANLVHEGLGHGGAALLLGAHPQMLNAIFFNYDEATVSRAAQRGIQAAGSIVNVLIGLPLLALSVRVRSRTWRYFLWLFAAVNLLTAFGYLIFSGVAGIGDWAHIVKDMERPVLLRVVMAIVGTVLYFVVAPRLLMPALDPFLGRVAGVRERRARTLSLIPYCAGAVALILAGLLNPYGFYLVLISAAAASLGGTSLLAWYPAIPRPPADGTPEPPLGLPRSVAWIGAAVVVLLFFVFVLGPGIGSVPPPSDVASGAGTHG